MDTMAEATYLAEEWKAIYNHERPHGSLDGMTPKPLLGKLDSRKPTSYRIGAGLLTGAQPLTLLLLRSDSSIGAKVRCAPIISQRAPHPEAEQVTAAHRSNHSTDIPGAAGAPDMTLKSGNPCGSSGFRSYVSCGRPSTGWSLDGRRDARLPRLQTRPVPLGVRRAARFCQSHLLRPKTSRRKEAHRRPSASPEVAAMFSTPCSRTMNPIDYSP